MSQVDLDLMERDVEAARNRLAGDIARLRNPAALSDFKHDVMGAVGSLKDEVVRNASNAATSTAQRVWSDLKDRAVANPGAAFAIGAGLVWHFARHPPITTLLVGLGFTSLMRTDPSTGPSPIVTRATELAGAVDEKVREWGEEAREVVGAVSEKARDLGEQARDAAGDLSRASSTAAEMVAHSTQVAKDAFSDGEARDNYLLGAAVLAIGAATVIAIQRRNQ